ncbi:MAG TPA: T9SS type A sorting domain-containing protein [Chitinophagaceae bacterium]|nr:T9SS type A sorting domain-containing protein [Chitinophagaceae bacterium]
MKNTMILSAFALSLFSFSTLQAQEKTIDLELQIVDNEEEVFVPFGEEYTVLVKLINHGPDILEEGDTIRLKMVGGFSNHVLYETEIHVNEDFEFPVITTWASEGQTENSTNEFCYELLESNSYVDNNTSNNSSCITITLEGNPLSLNELNAHSNLKIYPNPVKNEILHFENPWTTNDIKVTVRDMLGKEINAFSQFMLQGEVGKINTSQLSTGVYLLELQNDTERIVEKFTVE